MMYMLHMLYLPVIIKATRNITYILAKVLNYIIPDFYFTIGVARITQYTHVRNKNRNIQGSSPKMVKSDFPNLKKTALKGNNSIPLVANSFL